MFEAEINKLKEKKSNTVLTFKKSSIKQVTIKARINASQGKPTDLRLNSPQF